MDSGGKSIQTGWFMSAFVTLNWCVPHVPCLFTLSSLSGSLQRTRPTHLSLACCGGVPIGFHDSNMKGMIPTSHNLASLLAGTESRGQPRFTILLQDDSPLLNPNEMSHNVCLARLTHLTHKVLPHI